MPADQSPIAGERWKAIPGCDGYEASTEGRIRSLDRHLPVLNRWGQIVDRFHRGRVLALKPKPTDWGGVYLCFYSTGAIYWHVSRAVCWAFRGAPPSAKHEAAHLDGNTLNNRPWNVAWATPVENASHKKKHGTNPVGQKNGMATLRDRDIPSIVRRYADGESSFALAREFGTSVDVIRNVVAGRAWAMISCDKRAAAKARARQNMVEAPRR